MTASFSWPDFDAPRALGSLPIGSAEFLAIDFPGWGLRNFRAEFHGFWSLNATQLLFAIRNDFFFG